MVFNIIQQGGGRTCWRCFGPNDNFLGQCSACDERDRLEKQEREKQQEKK